MHPNAAFLVVRVVQEPALPQVIDTDQAGEREDEANVTYFSANCRVGQGRKVFPSGTLSQRLSGRTVLSKTESLLKILKLKFMGPEYLPARQDDTGASRSAVCRTCSILSQSL